VDSSSLFEASMSPRPSMIFAILPAMVQNRIPTIPSLRRSISEIRERAFYGKTDSLTTLPSPETPPPEYTSRAGSGNVTPSRDSIASVETEYEFLDDASEQPGSSMGLGTPMFATYEKKTGISWKYASSGTSTTSSTREEKLKTRRIKPHDPSIP